VNEDTLLPPKTLALPDNNCGHDLLSQFWLSLLDGAHDHVSGSGLGESIEASADIADGDDVEVLGAAVVAAVDHGGDGETGGDTVFDAGGVLAAAGSFFSHIELFRWCDLGCYDSE